MFTSTCTVQRLYALLAAVIIALISSVSSLVILLTVPKYLQLLSASVSWSVIANIHLFFLSSHVPCNRSNCLCELFPVSAVLKSVYSLSYCVVVGKGLGVGGGWGMSSGNILTHLTVLWHTACLLLLNFVITAWELIWCFL